MTTTSDHESRVKAWVDLIFGDRDSYSVTRVPGAALWLLALLADPHPEATEFTDWAAERTPAATATGAIVVITTTHVIYVRFENCPSQQEPTADQITGWVRRRSAVSSFTLSGGESMYSPMHRPPRCMTVRFDDGVTLELPLSGRADVPKLARLLL
jgi:hypothetical protein